MAVSECESRAVSRGASDIELAAAARQDPSSFLALYERYFPRVQRYVRIRIADRAACEDVTSQVFVAALAGLSQFRGRGSFAAWLFRIAQNAVRSHYREDRLAELDEAALAAVAGPGPDPHEEVLRTERRRQLRDALAELTPKQQNLLALRYGAELRASRSARSSARARWL